MNSWRRWPVAVAVLLVLAGCDDGAGGNGPADGEQTADGEQAETVTARSVRIGPYEGVPDTVPAGEVTFELLQEDSTAPHDLNIEELDVGTEVLEEGESESFTVELEPETYTYFCSVPGHREAGMEGEIEAVE